MIVIQNDERSNQEFESLLEKARIDILNDFQQKATVLERLNAIEFETMVCDSLKKLAVGTNFDGKISQTGALAFPDIIADDKLGVEVKKTTKDAWASVGNSVLETTRRPSVERIYAFFAKFGGVPDIRWKLYQDCLREIVVTHSPRYIIDMDLPADGSIFNKMNVQYDEFRQNDPIGKAKSYYRKQLKEGEQMWWMSVEEDTDKTSKPLIIKTYNSIDKDTRERFITESMVYFTEVFSNHRDKYIRIAAYLINKHNAVSSSLRDPFTAGGQVYIHVNNYDVLVPELYSKLQKRASEIKQIIQTAEEDLLKEYWRAETITDRENQWLQLLNSAAADLPPNVTAEDIYRSGLSATQPSQ